MDGSALPTPHASGVGAHLFHRVIAAYPAASILRPCPRRTASRSNPTFTSPIGTSQRAISRWYREDSRRPWSSPRADGHSSTSGALATDLSRQIDYLPVETDGAARAARKTAELRPSRRCSKAICLWDSPSRVWSEPTCYCVATHREAAAEELAAALPYWRRAQANLYLAELRRWAKQRKLPFPAPPQDRSARAVAASRASSVLSRREWEVAELVALGLTSVQIADRLAITVRTAEAQVEHIRNKLGSTRACRSGLGQRGGSCARSGLPLLTRSACGRSSAR